MEFRAFKDDTSSIDIGDLTFENNDQRVAIFGSINIGCDEQGLAQAKKIQVIINHMVSYLEQQDLPEQIETFEPKIVKNPFSNDKT